MHVKRLLQKIGWYREPANYTYLPDENHIELLNFWTSQPREEIWLYQFILQHVGSRLSKDNGVLLSSVFGPRNAIKESRSRIKVFYTGENVRRFHEYRDHCLNDVDISLGFDDINHPKYVRFPIWIFYFFGITQTQQEIQYVLDNFSLPPPPERGFCSLVSSHDKNGIRTGLFHALGRIEQVTSAGRLLNNSDVLRTRYNDDKTEMLRAFNFNICPENTDYPGYVTEKLFQCFRASTVPIYWGSGNEPEPDIVNPDAVLFYQGKHSLNQLVRRVEELHRDPEKYRAFLRQPKFKPAAAAHIWERINLLREKLVNLVNG
ncbi:hypothetical protein GCM10011386_25480 [Parapedobacter defluvii]|uniref:Glycosyltransferase family 10 (Fucosyltransferase) C-term n=1 Tax=Parapedobacter defluvii TaxID=2045106 RepID=A0ABQ1LZM3_9SPHI|nr:glycosyltransferase family 10 [Parapedobacter defluvii]GGC32253.1 hypothetical protein GCM10011386_25480 [Parapedobacter defluvii]